MVRISRLEVGDTEEKLCKSCNEITSMKYVGWMVPEEALLTTNPKHHNLGIYFCLKCEGSFSYEEKPLNTVKNG